MRITLPEPPSANRYWRKWRNRIVRTRAAEAYRDEVATRITISRFLRISGPVALEVRWFRSRKSGDLDNRLKVLLDALNGVAYEDDSQVVELHAYRSDDKNNPRVEIEITEAA